MRDLLPVLLLLIPLFSAFADEPPPVTCSHHNNSQAECQGYAGCKAVTFDGGYLCATKCIADELQDASTCESYAGCKWDTDWGECKYFEKEDHYYRAWDEIQQDFIEAPCPDEYPNAKPGTDSVHFCYKSCSSGDPGAEDCGFYNDPIWGGDLSCLKPNTNTLVPSSDYHTENTDECYLNERPCDYFEFDDHGADFTWHNNEVTLTHFEINGTAYWTSGQYDTSGCSMIADFRDERSVVQCNTRRLCPPQSTVPYATTHIQYDNGTTSNSFYYYCTSCLSAGYYPTTVKPSGTQHSLPACNNPTTGEYTACSCAQIKKGFYGNCETAWTSTTPLSQCEPHACPVGQTTNGPGTIGNDSCRFGGYTRICDGNASEPHCTTLDGTGSLSLSDWDLLISIP